jgi:O-antigen/teichoic acid export membrane protein
MQLVKTSFLSFIATVIKMISALVINKAIAIYIGPTGLAMIGQFQNFIHLTLTAAQSAINTGVTKYTAEYGSSSEKMASLFSTAIKISLISSIIVSVGLIYLSSYTSLQLLNREDLGYIFVIFGLTITLFVINNLLLSILNGLKEIKTWALINIIQSVYSLIFTTLLIFWFGLPGALIGLVTNQSVILVIVLWMLRRHETIKLKNFTKSFSTSEGRKLGGFALMAITSAIVAPLSHMFVRSYIGETLDWNQAGYWQAIWYISTIYLTVVTTTLGIYYLPRLSEIKTRQELQKEIFNGYKIILPIVTIMAVIIFILKDTIIWLLFSNDFLEMRGLFLWHLVGDVVKIASFMLAYLMLAKEMVKIYIFLEIFFGLFFVALSYWCIENYGLIGTSYAFAASYIMYLLAVTVATRKFLKN